MLKTLVLVRLVALLFSIAATVSAQTPSAPAAPSPQAAPAASPTAPTTAVPADVPAPAAPTTAAPAAAPAPAAASAAPIPVEPPQPASPLVQPAVPTFAAEPPPPPARPSGPADYDGHFIAGAAWDVAFPVGSVRRFASKPSALGFEVLLRYFVLRNLSIGASTDFQTFLDTRPRTTYPIENGAVTATAYNSIQGAAVRALLHYYFVEQGPVLPYAGVNIGVGWSTFQTAAADLTLYTNQTSVVLGGDVGALFPIWDAAPMFMAGLRYSALPAAEFMNVTATQSFTLELGLLTN